MECKTNDHLYLPPSHRALQCDERDLTQSPHLHRRSPVVDAGRDVHVRAGFTVRVETVEIGLREIREREQHVHLPAVRVAWREAARVNGSENHDAPERTRSILLPTPGMLRIFFAALG